LAFTLGESADAKSTSALADILKSNIANPLIIDAAFTSLAGRELELAERHMRDPDNKLDGVLATAASCVFAERKPERILRLFTLIADQKDMARQAAMLEGIIPRTKGKAPLPKAVEMQATPPSLQSLSQSADKRVATAAAAIAKLIVPPGTLTTVKTLPPLTPEQQALYELGKMQYTQICAQCHQPSGSGEEGKAPPLADSEWVDYSEQRLVRIVLNGIKGPVSVNGREFNMEMPGVPQLDDKTIAGCLTYIRREFGKGQPVDPTVVGKIRKAIGERDEQWTEAELLKLE